VTSRQETLEQRAARYFGAHNKPRRSVRLNNQECLIVSDCYSDKMLVMYYHERYGKPHGDHIKLTPRAAKEFLEAMEAFYVAP
jgi:hypothetical protein